MSSSNFSNPSNLLNLSNNSRFKSDPYNPNNFLIQHSDVMNIMKNLHIHDFKINEIDYIKRHLFINLIVIYLL